MNTSGALANFPDSPCPFQLVVKVLAIAEGGKYLVLTETHVRGHGLGIEFSLGTLAPKSGHHRCGDTLGSITIALELQSVCHYQ
jgi:hypothetical protein